MRPKKSSDNEADNYALFSVIIRPTNFISNSLKQHLPPSFPPLVLDPTPFRLNYSLNSLWHRLYKSINEILSREQGE